MKNVNIKFGISKAKLVQAGVASKKPEEIMDSEVTLTGLASFVDNVQNQETGEIEEKEISVIAYEKDGTKGIVSSPSDTLRNCISLLIETYSVEELEAGLPVVFEYGKSNSGRKFITMYPVE